MTQTHDERRARALYEDSCAGDPNMMSWEEFKAHHGMEYEGVRRFYSRACAIRQSDDAAGFVLVPRASLQSIYDDYMSDALDSTELSLHCLATLTAMLAATGGDDA